MSWHRPVGPNGKRGRRTGFVGTFQEAKDEKDDERIRMRRGEVAEVEDVAEPDDAMPTLYAYAMERFADEFAPRVQHGTDRYESSYRLRIHPALGAYLLDEITPSIVRAWCDDLIREYGDRRCGEYAYRTLHWLLAEAVDEGLLPTNVAAGVKYIRRARAAVSKGAPSAEDFERKKPTLNRSNYEQVKAHAATVGVYELALVRLAVEGTLRRAELLGLLWEDFDPVARTFEVKKGVTATRKTGRVRGATKNRQSVRTIVLSRSLCDLLVTYRAICQQRGHGDDGHYLFPGYGEHRLHEPVPTLPLNPRTMTAWVCDLIRDAGVIDENGKHLTDLQGLRATGASIADAAGVPESIIEAQLGHKGRGVYQRHYRDVRTAPERFQFADVFETTPTTLASTAVDQNRGSDEQLQLVLGA